MKLSTPELIELFKQQSRKHGLIQGVLRTLDKKNHRLESRRLLNNYIKPHDLGLEVNAGDETISPPGTKLAHADKEAKGTLATEFFPAEKIPYEEQTFDFVLAENVIEKQGDPVPALKEWYRVMNEGGHLFLFVTKSALDPRKLEETLAGNRWEVLETLDPVADRADTYAVVARRKREKSGIIEVLKLQQGESGN